AVGSRSATTREPSFLLDAWLIDDEAIDIFRYRAMRHAAIAGAAPPNARDTLYFQPGRGAPSKPDRVHFDQALDSLRRGEIDLLIVDQPLTASEAAQLDGRQSELGWWLYRSPPSNLEDSPADSQMEPELEETRR
ncbi:MAG: hypothetical protein AAF657_37305, partial [Acidobacteriota bacterium]